MSSPSSSNNNSNKRWFPLESNPTLINDYIHKLGFDTSIYEFVDVYSTEDWALDMIAKPVIAVIMLYPLTEKQVSYSKENDILLKDTKDIEKNQLWFIKQRIGNACGTIGLLHALYNIPPSIQECIFISNTWIRNFKEDCPIRLLPIEKAELLEKDNKVAKLHDEATSSTINSTNRGTIDDKLMTHFISFVCGSVDNQLYELDGRKDGPVLHGKTSPETLLQDSCKIIQQFIQRDPSDTRFTVLALAPKTSF